MLPGEASARGTKTNQRQFHLRPSKERAAMLLGRLGHGLRIGGRLVACRIFLEPGEDVQQFARLVMDRFICVRDHRQVFS